MAPAEIPSPTQFHRDREAAVMAPAEKADPVPTLREAAQRVIALSEDPRRPAMPADANAEWRDEWEQAFDWLVAALGCSPSPFDKLERLLLRHIHSPEDWAAYRLRIFTALCELSEEERERDPVAADSDQLIDFGAALLWLSQPDAVQKKASELDMRFAATARLIFEGAVEEMRQLRRQQRHSAQQSQPLTPRAEPATAPQWR